MTLKTTLSLLCLAAVSVAGAETVHQPGVSPGPGTRYATDAYPGFDSESEIVAPSKKEPKWFAWINGPNCTNATEQYAYCERLMLDGSHSKAARQLDALVREWPVSPEAPQAQKRLAEILLTQLDDPEEAFAAYRYLVDFFSLSFDFSEMLDRMYEIAKLMRRRGKDIVFFHFDNTVDVRRAFEACVMRAPGAKWAPEALLTIANLREDEGKYAAAVRVYENLRNLHAGTEEARKAFLCEARCRMLLLDDHGYNRARCQDTIDFLKLALRNCELTAVDEIKSLLARASDQIAGEAYRAAKFYDSKTRTVRSAISAYERFLADYPESSFAPAARERLNELKGQN